MRAFSLLSVLSLVAAVRLQPPGLLSRRRLNWSLGKPCEYAQHPFQAVKAALQRSVVAQDAAVSQVLDAVRAWDDDHLRGIDRPLVLTLTGTTGVGKTWTALTVASALLAGRSSGSGSEPDGLVFINGADYSESGDVENGEPGGSHKSNKVGSPGPGLLALQQRLRDTLAQGLYECHGHSVIVFDEAQKAVRRALDVLTPLMQRDRPALTYYERPEADARPHILSAARAVIIVISDVGEAQIDRYIQQAAKQSSSSTTDGSGEALLRSLAINIHFALSDEWKSAGVDLGGLSNAVVPFLPFNQTGARTLLAHSLRQLCFTDFPDWDRLVIDTANVAAALTDPSIMTNVAYVDSNSYRHSDGEDAGASSDGSVPSSVSVGADGSVSASHNSETYEKAARSAKQKGKGARRLCVTSATESDHPCACTLPPTVVSTWGGRGLLQMDTSPFEMLKRRIASVTELLGDGNEGYGHGAEESDDYRADTSSSNPQRSTRRYSPDDPAILTRTVRENELEAEYRALVRGDAPQPPTHGPNAKSGCSGNGIKGRVQRFVTRVASAAAKRRGQGSYSGDATLEMVKEAAETVKDGIVSGGRLAGSLFQQGLSFVSGQPLHQQPAERAYDKSFGGQSSNDVNAAADGEEQNAAAEPDPAVVFKICVDCSVPEEASSAHLAQFVFSRCEVEPLELHDDAPSHQRDCEHHHHGLRTLVERCKELYRGPL